MSVHVCVCVSFIIIISTRTSSLTKFGDPIVVAFLNNKKNKDKNDALKSLMETAHQS